MVGGRVVAVVVVVACFVAGCSTSGSTGHSGAPGGPSVTPTATSDAPLPAGTRELPSAEGGRLPAGRFTKADFSPRLSFQLGPGWQAGHDIAGFFDVQQRPNTPDVIAVQFALPFDAGGAAAVVQQLQHAPGLRVTPRGLVRVGGLPARAVQIDSRNSRLTPARYTQIFSVAGGDLYIGSGRRLLVDFVEVHGTLVAVLVGGSVRSWAATMRATTPVVRSIQFL